jgi:hypothetical protein
LFLTRGLDEYTPVGLTGRQDWPTPERLPTLPAQDSDGDFPDLWREAFAAGPSSS